MKKPLFKCIALMFCPLIGWAQWVSLDGLASSVNGSIILHSDIQKFRKTLPLRRQLDPLFGNSQIAKKSSFSDEQVVQFLMNERLILESYPIEDNEVEEQIKQIETENRLDRKTLKNLLKQQGFAFKDYFDLIRVSVAKKKLIDQDIRSKVNVSDDDVKNYFYNHYTPAHGVSKRYRISMITLDPSRYASYAKAKDLAMDILQSLETGAEFDDLAKKYSDDSTASSGGDLGFMKENELSPVIQKELKKMKLGQVASIFPGPKAPLFILKFVDIKSGQEDQLRELKETIRNQLMSKQFSDQIDLWLERRRQEAYIHRPNDKSVPEKYVRKKK